MGDVQSNNFNSPLDTTLVAFRKKFQILIAKLRSKRPTNGSAFRKEILLFLVISFRLTLKRNYAVY